MFKRRKLSLSDGEYDLNDENHDLEGSLSPPKIIYRPITRGTACSSSLASSFIGVDVNKGDSKAPPDQLFKRTRRGLKCKNDKFNGKSVQKQLQNKKEIIPSKHKVWSYQERNLFFDALQEHGRDFEAIANYLKKRNIQKTKQQVRCFFYNTWHRVCKYIDGIHEDRFDLPFQLYGMINYGEFRRKLGSKIDDKRRRRFNELVINGTSTVKVGKKFVRLATPICEALKKINNIRDKGDKRPQVPQKIALEVRPKNTAAWTHVQDLAQNPRIRVTVQANERLSSVIAYLTKKWQPKYSHDNKSNSVVDETSKGDLKLYPPDGCEMFPYNLEPQTSPSIMKFSLKEYLGKVKNKKDKKLLLIPSSTFKSPDRDSETDDSCSADNRKHNSDLTVKNNLLKNDNRVGDDPLLVENPQCLKSNSLEMCNDKIDLYTDDDVYSSSVEEKDKPTSSNADQILENFREVLPTFGRMVTNSNCDADSNHNDSHNNESVEEKNPELEKFREGWTSLSASKMTIAEVYLLLRGSDGKCNLEYDWTNINDEQNELERKFTNLLRRLSFLATTEFASNFDINASSPSANPKSAANGMLFSPGISSTPKACQKKKSRGCGNLAPKVLLPSSPGNHAINDVSAIMTQNQISTTQHNPHSTLQSTKPLIDHTFKVPTHAPLAPHIYQSIRISPNSEESFLQRLKQSLPPRKRIKSKPVIVQRILPLLPKVISSSHLITQQNTPNVNINSNSNQVIITNQVKQECYADNFTVMDNLIQNDYDRINCSDASIYTSVEQSFSHVNSFNNNNNTIYQIACNGTVDERQKDDAVPIDFKGGTIYHNVEDIPSLLSFNNENANGRISSKISSSFLDFSISDSFLNKFESDPSLSSADRKTDFLNALRSVSPFKSQSKSTNSVNDPHWLSIDEFSLSNFIESPTKKCDENNQNDVIDNNREFLVTKLDVDSALHCMMNENSLDYITKFADLAAQVTTNSSIPGSHIATNNYNSKDKVNQ